MKEFVKKHNIELEDEDLDVASDEKARDEMIKKSGQMEVSAVDIERKIILGFDQGAIKKRWGYEF